MPKTITFNELRRIKASLPEGSTHVIAEKLNLSVQPVRNYFGGFIVVLDDPTILDMALEILEQNKKTEKQEEV